MRKLLINLVMLILAFTIQICVFPQIAFLSSAPNLLLIVVFVCSFIEGRERGMFYGLVAGLFMDLFYSGPFGFYTLFFINLGYVSGICNKYYYEDYITLPLLFPVMRSVILVSVICQVLKHSGREDQAFLTSLAGLVLVLFWIVPYIYELFETIKNLFAL